MPIEGVSLIRDIALVVHIIGVVIAIGAATATDFLHLRGLLNRKFEKKIVDIFPVLSQIIFIGLGIIILAGGVLLYYNPSLLRLPIFQLKFVLVGIVIVNGIILGKYIGPMVKKDILNDHPKENFKKVSIISSIFGSISVVTWYSILILALTYGYGYSVPSFLLVYFGALILVFLTSMAMEFKFHRN